MMEHHTETPRRHSPKSVIFAVDTAVVSQSDTIANTSPVASKRSHGGKSRGRKRAGTPPPMGARKAGRAADGSLESDDSDAPPVITDPLRASLTWQENEITIYDPEDSDDDGTGINGIGFKPTPANAYARTVRRRQQLADYKKMEEREARARRSHRRRGSPIPGLVELKGKVERRRVRFLESSSKMIGV